MIEKREKLHKPDTDKSERWNIFVNSKFKSKIMRLQAKINDDGRVKKIKNKSDFFRYATDFLDENIDEIGAQKNEIKAQICKLDFQSAEIANKRNLLTKRLAQLDDPQIVEAYRARTDVVNVFKSKPIATTDNNFITKPELSDDQIIQNMKESMRNKMELSKISNGGGDINESQII